jgi:rubrerythrin
MQETINNLAAAFVGESQARNRYTIYAKVARDEGYEQIAGIFEETANQEKTHAKQLMKMIQDLKKHDVKYPAIQVAAEVPNVWDTTAENLKAAIAGEHWENTEMYPGFADKADEEGLSAVATRLRAIAKAELHHENRYTKLLSLVGKDIMFKRAAKVWWCCRECGYIHEGTEPPKVCPACDHPQAFYQLLVEEY